MNKRVVLALFICVAAAQIAVPASMIFKRETTLREGRQYRFVTAPVDPYDPFRGRYVALGIKENTAPVPKGESFNYHEPVYAVLEENQEGFARISAVTRKRPQGNTYIRAKVTHPNTSKVTLGLPFDRYYAEENIAPAIERAYRRHSRREKHDAYITVRVKAGFAVLEELYIDDIPILDFVRQEAEKEG